MSMIGTRVLRREDRALLTGDARFVDDLRFADGDGPVDAHVVFVRSTEAHAELGTVHVDEAASAPGVIGVWTAETIGLSPIPPIAPFFPEAAARPVLAQFAVMPLLGLAVARLLGLPDELAAGVILVGCAPGGTASKTLLPTSAPCSAT